jgi:hypothetical protein
MPDSNIAVRPQNRQTGKAALFRGRLGQPSPYLQEAESEERGSYRAGPMNRNSASRRGFYRKGEST